MEGEGSLLLRRIIANSRESVESTLINLWTERIREGRGKNVPKSEHLHPERIAIKSGVDSNSQIIDASPDITFSTTIPIIPGLPIVKIRSEVQPSS